MITDQTLNTCRAKGNPVPIPELGSGITYHSGRRKSVGRGNPKMTLRRRRDIREQFSFLYKRSSSLQTSSREIGFGTRRATQLRRCPDLPLGT